VLKNLQIKLQKEGVRLVTCVVDGHPVEPFYVYPDAYEKFGGLTPRFFQYLERSARSILDQFGDRYGRKVA